MQKSRLKWIDMMRGIAMLFVVMQHMSAYLTNDFVYARFLSLTDIGIFFFVSGYILDKTSRLESNITDVLKFILKKTIQLLVPFCIWGLIAKHYFFVSMPTSISIDEMCNLWHNPFLWFLLTLYGYMYYFVGYKLIISTDYYKKKRYSYRIWFVFLYAMICLGILFAIWYMYHEFKLAILYLPFFIIGTFVSHFDMEFIMRNNVIRGFSVLIILILAAVWKQGEQDVFFTIIKYIVTFSAIIVLYMIFTEFCLNNVIEKFLIACGKYSIAIYCMHWPFIKIFPSNFTIETNNELYGILFTMVLAIFVCIFCIFIKMIVAKIPWLDCLLFGNVKHNSR